MSDDTKALCARLRTWGVENCPRGFDVVRTVEYQAAATIERLERELAEARRDAKRCRASVDVAHTLPVPDDAMPFTCCCCRQTHYMAPVSAEATPLRRPMSQGGGIVYDPHALAADNARLREALSTLRTEAINMCDDTDIMPDDMAAAITAAGRCLAAPKGAE